MCGLTGVLLYPMERSADDWESIKEITMANLVFNEERGREASGVAVIRNDGTYHLFKQPVQAGDLVTMDGFRSAFSSIGEKTTCILGHTRAPTKGTRWNNANNHPIPAGNVIGIHNGTIRNDDDLFEELDLPRNGEVDSEIIFRLQDTVNPATTNGQYAPRMTEHTRRLEGTFSTLSVDLRDPTGLLALKHLRPLCIHYEEPWQALFFSSRYVFLRKAFGRSVITEALDSGRGYYYNAERLPEQGNRPLFSFDIEDRSEWNKKPSVRKRVAHNR